MKTIRMVIATLAATASIFTVTAAESAISSAAVTVDASLVTRVADGCGLGGWRGRWGHCHYRGGRFYGPGFVRPPVYNGCPAGSWRGPWGHCRNTPYHGRLPDGSWK